MKSVKSLSLSIANNSEVINIIIKGRENIIIKGRKNGFQIHRRICHQISAICVSPYKIFSNYRNIVFEIDVSVWTN